MTASSSCFSFRLHKTSDPVSHGQAIRFQATVCFHPVGTTNMHTSLCLAWLVSFRGQRKKTIAKQQNGLRISHASTFKQECVPTSLENQTLCWHTVIWLHAYFGRAGCIEVSSWLFPLGKSSRKIIFESAILSTFKKQCVPMWDIKPSTKIENIEAQEMRSESLGYWKISYCSCAHQKSCESLAAVERFLSIRFNRRTNSIAKSFPDLKAVCLLKLLSRLVRFYLCIISCIHTLVTSCIHSLARCECCISNMVIFSLWKKHGLPRSQHRQQQHAPGQMVKSLFQRRFFPLRCRMLWLSLWKF